MTHFARRSFLLGLPLVGTSALLFAQNSNASVSEKPSAERPTVDSLPVLQNPTDHGISVVWAVNGPATGWVEYGATRDLGSRADTPKYGLNPLEDRFLTIRLQDLTPNTTYYYRTATVRFKLTIEQFWDYSILETVHSPIYSFTTAGKDTDKISLAIINDTHGTQPTYEAIAKRIGVFDPDYTVWNGDIITDYYTPDQVVKEMMQPAGQQLFASEKPVLFVRGNHDARGPWVRHLPQCFPTWIHDAPDNELGYNFAIRQGPVAIIGLDTGEDKQDSVSQFLDLCRFDQYRIAQRDWLERVLKRPDIASAPFLIACCHIPIFHKNVMPDGNDGLHGFGDFSRLGYQLWGPLLHKAGAQLVFCGHTHDYRCDEPTEYRCWRQIVGGGNILKRNGATIVHVQGTAQELTVVSERLLDNSELGRWTIKPRA